jgi:hypothetical protein
MKQAAPTLSVRAACCFVWRWICTRITHPGHASRPASARRTAREGLAEQPIVGFAGALPVRQLRAVPLAEPRHATRLQSLQLSARNGARTDGRGGGAALRITRHVLDPLNYTALTLVPRSTLKRLTRVRGTLVPPGGRSPRRASAVPNWLLPPQTPGAPR